MFEWMWDEKLWFPENSTGPTYGWKDLENQPGSNTYNPQVSDLHWSFILGFCLLGIRYLFQKLFVEPLGHFLGVSRRKPPIVADNAVLENAYKHNRKITPDKVKSHLNDFHQYVSIATHTPGDTLDLIINPLQNLVTVILPLPYTDHHLIDSFQANGYARTKDRNLVSHETKKDAPSQMKKFEDCFWHFIFYSTAFIYGLCVLWDKPWFKATKLCWMEWPRLHVSDEIYWYYIVEMAFYWSLILSLVKDHRRKDFTELVIHHVATIILLYFSWFMNFVRIGTLVLLAHDAADPWLAFAKMSNYTKYRQAKETAFVIFIIVWILSRLIYYPFFVLYCSTFEPFHVIEKTFFAHWFFNFFLYVLMVLHLMWSYSIAKIVINKLRQGEVEDVRSESESDENFDSNSDCDINRNGPNGVTNGPNSVTNGPNGVTYGPNSATNGPNGVTNGPNGVTNGPNGVTNLQSSNLTTKLNETSAQIS